MIKLKNRKMITDKLNTFFRFFSIISKIEHNIN